MEANNFDLKGFLNSPQAQANKPAAMQYLQSKGIIDANGNPISSAIKAPVTTNKPFDLLNNPVTRGIQSFFPGKKVGESIGTLGGLALTKAQEALGFAPKGSTAQYDISSPSTTQVLGDIAQGALTVGAPGIGTGETTLARIGANAALGAGISGAGAIAEGKPLKEVAKETAIGGALGGGLSAATEGVSYLTKNLPNWLTKSALPKLDEKNIDYALKNTKIGSTPELLKNSDSAWKSYRSQIKGILEHPEYVNQTGDTGLINKVSELYPNAQMDTKKVISIAKQVAPANKSLIDKVAEGTATLLEQETLKKELDFATRKAYGDKPTLTFAKQVGKSLADLLRNNIQTSAPETVPIFENYSKELNLNAALQALNKKNNLKPTFVDVLAGFEGYKEGGLKGALAAIAAERTLGSGAFKLGAAKAATALNKPEVIKGVSQAIKAPLIKGLTQ